jgi:hypothetical protein
MASPAKMARDDSSPRTQGSNGSHYASPSTLPSAYSPAETRNQGPQYATQGLTLEELLNRINLGAQSKAPAAQSFTGSPDPFTGGRAQFTLQHSATAPNLLRPDAKSWEPARHSMHNLLEGSTPEHFSGGRRNFTEEVVNQNARDQTARPSPEQATKAPLSPVSPRRSKVMSSECTFTSDANIAESGTSTRYLALRNIDPKDADERTPGSRLIPFKQVSLFSFITLHISVALTHLISVSSFPHSHTLH